jgi:subtilisin family serine protease
VHRPTALLALAALSASGLALATPAVAAPAPGASPVAHAAAPDELVVGYVAGATPAAQARARARAGAVRAERVVPARADRAEVELVRLPAGKAREAAVRELESDPAVAYAEPNWTYTHQATPTDPYFTDRKLWGLEGGFGSGASTAWSTNTGSAGVYVGVIDEGIQFDHPDLAGQVWTNPGDPANGRDDDGNGYVDDVHGFDFANDDSSVYDGGTRGSLDDHGTHVAGTIGAKADGNGVVGVNHAVTMISGKFLGRRGGALTDAVQAVDYFTDLKRRGVNVVATNNSWGGGGYSQALRDAISRANEQGVLFVAAAGNSGTDNDVTASYPSNYDLPNVVAVAAIDVNGGLASFSQYGATTVDLGAPGVGIWSTTAYSGWSSYNGTSMATPHVTGAAALYAASHPGADAATIKGALLSSAKATASLVGKTVTGGRLDASGF